MILPINSGPKKRLRFMARISFTIYTKLTFCNLVVYYCIPCCVFQFKEAYPHIYKKRFGGSTSNLANMLHFR